MEQNNLEISMLSTNFFKMNGIINFETINTLIDQVKKQKTTEAFTFDLNDIQKIDSSLISFLLECRRQKKEIRLINVPNSLESLIKLYGLKDFFNLTDGQTLVTI